MSHSSGPAAGERDEAACAAATELRADEGTPLYVHLPFCAAKCPYCDFYSVVDEGPDVVARGARMAMVDAMLREAERRAPLRPTTVFLGGGTPSLLAADELARLLDGLDRLTGFRDAALEVTAECNPESLDRDKARVLRELGVRRVSIGFQSLRQETLELFGRVHSVDQSFAAYDAARAAGFEAVNVDLIYAAPGQTAAAWREDLGRVLALGPDHLSAYNLTFEEETPFRRWLEEGRLARAPEELELELFWTARELTVAAGLEPYEVSNFALPGQHCRHNVNYWRNGPYVGLGPSAVSKVGDRRFGNARSISRWQAAVADGRPAVEWTEELLPLARLGETWWLGLRLAEGVDPAAARARAGYEAGDPEHDPALERVRALAAQGFVEERDGRWRLSRAGLPLGDHVARLVLRACGEPARA